MGIHRYTLTKVNQDRLRSVVESSLTVGEYANLPQIDITLSNDAFKADLDAAMADLGFEFLESNPANPIRTTATVVTLDGTAGSLSTAGTANVRYNPTTNQLELSTNGGPYGPLTTVQDHRTLRQLIHLADNDGPMDGFTSGLFEETLPANNPFPTSIIWWEDNTKVKKIVENLVTYNINKTINTDEYKVYSTDGVTVLATITDTYDYSPGILTPTRTRTVT
jgi:hypothetical protein